MEVTPMGSMETNTVKLGNKVMVVGCGGKKNTACIGTAKVLGSLEEMVV